MRNTLIEWWWRFFCEAAYRCCVYVKFWLAGRRYLVKDTPAEQVQKILAEQLPAGYAPIVLKQFQQASNLTVELEGGWVVKFPRNKTVAYRMKKEARLLKAIKEQLGDAVPFCEFFEMSYPFSIYQKMPGRPLRDIYEKEWQGQMPLAAWEELGRLVGALHMVRLRGWNRRSMRWYSIIRCFKALLYVPACKRHLSAEEYRLLKKCGWRAFCQSLDIPHWRINHGDLHGGNVLYSEDGKLSLIDFIDTTYRPVYLDIRKLLSSEVRVREFFTAYSQIRKGVIMSDFWAMCIITDLRTDLSRGLPTAQVYAKLCTNLDHCREAVAEEESSGKLAWFRKKALYERYRRLLSFICCTMLGTVLLFGRSKWELGHPLIEEGLMAGGCFLAGIGAFGRIWSALYIAGYKNRTLVQDGPYSLCRNPLYLFSLIGALGVGLVSETVTIPLCVLAAFICYYPVVIRREESRLFERFGQDYRDYQEGVPAFWPRLKAVFNLSQPESYVVRPRVFFLRIIDALWFFWLIGILEFLEALHEKGLVPIYFNLF